MNIKLLSIIIALVIGGVVAWFTTPVIAPILLNQGLQEHRTDPPVGCQPANEPTTGVLADYSTCTISLGGDIAVSKADTKISLTEVVLGFTTYNTQPPRYEWSFLNAVPNGQRVAELDRDHFSFVGENQNTIQIDNSFTQLGQHRAWKADVRWKSINPDSNFSTATNFLWRGSFFLAVMLIVAGALAVLVSVLGKATGG